MKRLTWAALIGFVLGVTGFLGAQNTIRLTNRQFDAGVTGNILKVNGNTISATAGTATLTFPNATQTMIGGSNLCAIGNWCQTIVTLTDAQIKALPTTAITLVAAQGSGYRVKVLGLSLRVNTSAGAYTNINTTYSALEVVYDTTGTWVVTPVVNDNSVTGLTRLSDLLGAAATILNDPAAAYIDNPNSEASVPFAATDYVLQSGATLGTAGADNQLLKIRIDNNGSGNLTGGNASNTIKVTVYWAKEAV